MVISGHVDTRWTHLWTREKAHSEAINGPVCPRVHKNRGVFHESVIGTYMTTQKDQTCMSPATSFLEPPENGGHRVFVDTGEKNPRSQAKKRVSTPVSNPCPHERHTPIDHLAAS